MEDKLLNLYVNHLNKVNRSDIHFQDVSHLLIFMRLIIEKENNSNIYPNINFFSNWYLHPKLDRNSFAKERLKSIYELMLSKFSRINNNFIFEDDNDFYIKISNIIGINALKQEIMKFNRDFSISNRFDDRIYSDNFLRLYLTGICNRPLIFQENSKKLFEDILIKGFQFIEVGDKIHFEILTNLKNNPFIFNFLSKID